VIACGSFGRRGLDETREHGEHRDRGRGHAHQQVRIGTGFDRREDQTGGREVSAVSAFAAGRGDAHPQAFRRMNPEASVWCRRRGRPRRSRSRIESESAFERGPTTATLPL